MKFFEKDICVLISFEMNTGLMSTYFIIVCVSCYFYGRHCGEYYSELTKYNKLCLIFFQNITPIILTVTWIIYLFFFQNFKDESVSIYPWITVYMITYTFTSLVSTFAFACHCQYRDTITWMLLLLLCTFIPFGMIFILGVLFLSKNKIMYILNYNILPLFGSNNSINFCLSVDLYSVILVTYIIIMFLCHIFIISRVILSCCINNNYLSNPNNKYPYHVKGTSTKEGITTNNDINNSRNNNNKEIKKKYSIIDNIQLNEMNGEHNSKIIIRNSVISQNNIKYDDINYIEPSKSHSWDL